MVCLKKWKDYSIPLFLKNVPRYSHAFSNNTEFRSMSESGQFGSGNSFNYIIVNTNVAAFVGTSNVCY